MTNTQFKTIRKNLNLTQIQLAQQLDKSVKSIQFYEQGSPIPSLIAKIMTLLNTNESFKNKFFNDVNTHTPLLSPPLARHVSHELLLRVHNKRGY